MLHSCIPQDNSFPFKVLLFDLKTLGNLATGTLIERKNRFLATAFIDNKIKKVHIADTGRLEEILTPNRELLLVQNCPGLKTDYTLLAAKMEEGWVLINTKLHSQIAYNAIQKGLLGFQPNKIQKEVTFYDSRLDFKADDTYIELKGCSLVQHDHCLFPNAPTTRGVKHIKALIKAVLEGYKGMILIMAVRKCQCFEPHPTRDDVFKKIFYKALRAGVKFEGFFTKIDQDFNILYDGKFPLC